MSFRKHGFLTRDIRRHRGQIRRAHADWFRLAYRLNRIGQDIVLIPKEVESEYGYSDYRIVAMLYFTRALSAFQAAIVLAERGMISEMNQITRGIVETTAMLAGLHKHKQDFVKDLASADYAERQAAGNWYLKTPKLTELVGKENQEKLQNFLDELKEADFPIKKLFIAHVASDAGLTELYAIYRHLSHNYGHATVTAVGNFTITDPDTGVKGIFWSPEYGQDLIAERIGYACACLFGALLAMNEVLATEGVSRKITKAFDVYRELTESFVKEK